MTYLLIKKIHILCAGISIAFFILRGLWMLAGSALLQNKIVRVTPHIIDTILLLSAIYLVIYSQQYPLAQHWITAKIVALFFYIGFGAIAITYGKTILIRFSALCAALLSVGYIVAVALTRNPFIL